jgi:hypothetical protein
MLGNFVRYMSESWVDTSDEFLPFDADLTDSVEGEFGPFFGADEQQLSVCKSTAAGPEINFSSGTDGNWTVSAAAENVGEVRFGLTGDPVMSAEMSYPLPWNLTASAGSCRWLSGFSTDGSFSAGLKVGPLCAKISAQLEEQEVNTSAYNGPKFRFGLDATTKFPISDDRSVYLTYSDGETGGGSEPGRVGVTYRSSSWTIAARQSLSRAADTRATTLLAQAVTDGKLGTVSGRVSNSADGWSAAAALRWLLPSFAFPTTIAVSGNTDGEIGAGLTVDVVECSVSLGAHSQIENRRPTWPTFGVEAKF